MFLIIVSQNQTVYECVLTCFSVVQEWQTAVGVSCEAAWLAGDLGAGAQVECGIHGLFLWPAECP